MIFAPFYSKPYIMLGIITCLVVEMFVGCGTGRKTMATVNIVPRVVSDIVLPVVPTKQPKADTTIVIQKAIPDKELLATAKHNGILLHKSVIKDSMNYDLSRTIIQLTGAITTLQDRLADQRESDAAIIYRLRDSARQAQIEKSLLKDSVAEYKAKEIVKLDKANTATWVFNWFPPLAGAICFFTGLFLGSAGTAKKEKKRLFGITLRAT